MRRLARRSLPCLFLFLTIAVHSPAVAERGMTVEEMVAVATFTKLGTGEIDVVPSPDGQFLVAVQELPTPDHKALQADILLWSVADLDRAATTSTGAPAPRHLAKFTSLNGPVVNAVKWTPDSHSIAVLATEEKAVAALWRVPLSGTRQRISLPSQNVRSFDIAASAILFTASAVSPDGESARQPDAPEAIAQTGTGKALQDLLFPEEIPNASDWVELWRWSGGEPSRISVKGPIRLSEDRNPLRLSPDGKFAIIDFPVTTVPDQWSRFAVDTRLNVVAGWTSGPQRFTDKNALVPHQYHLIDIASGVATPIADGPDAQSRGFLLASFSIATWSADGTHLAISAMFLPGHATPCVTVMAMASGKATCARLIGQSQAFGRIRKIEFVGGSNEQLRIDAEKAEGPRNLETFLFDRATATWKLAAQEPWRGEQANRFYIRQDMNTPPALIDRQQGSEHAIYDPNPQIDKSRLGLWESVTIPLPGGASIRAGLLLPDGPPPPQGFPLIVQTHGFDPRVFSPSGIYEAPFAAQALLREGFAVVQLPVCPVGTSEEVPCSLEHYRSALTYLSNNHHINPNEVGIIGFSRTCIHVMAALTDPSFKFKAAVIQNGYMNTISQYFGSIDYYGGFVNGWMGKMVGGKPYGEGLANWSSGSPSFKYDRLNTPLRVEANGRPDAMFMWEPYAAMRDRGAPADFIMLRQGTHPLSNPAERLASQQGAVDWFAYWLKGRKDPSPAKEAQYKRWDAMGARAPEVK